YAFHYRGGKKRLNVGWVNREALAEVVREFNQDDLWNCPFQVNHHVRLAINQQLGNFGLQVTEYRLEEVTWSLTNHKWRRNRSPLAIQGNEDYWRGEADLNLSY
ncbi:MAG TPA: hypothetical protein VJ302_26565, partial [Blastocatellia bacterium]|nr:hypothetical protein [Blastocatellia bacterium]